MIWFHVKPSSKTGSVATGFYFDYQDLGVFSHIKVLLVRFAIFVVLPYFWPCYSAATA